MAQNIQSTKSRREFEKVNAQLKVLSKRLVKVEQDNMTLQRDNATLKLNNEWLYTQVKEGLGEIVTNAVQRIANDTLTAEVVYEEPSLDKQLTTALQGANNVKPN